MSEESVEIQHAGEKAMKLIGRLHILTDDVLQTRFSHVQLAGLAARGGADAVQFRQKSGSTREMIETATMMKRVCGDHGVNFIVNDRIDVAIAVEADGVHLGQDDFPIPKAREMLGYERIIGGSASSLEEVYKCVAEGADYIGFGPVFATSSKADAGPAGGLELLRRVVMEVSVPVIAIGGITEENGADVLKAGAYGLAVISAVCCREDPEGATRALHDIIGVHTRGAAHNG